MLSNIYLVIHQELQTTEIHKNNVVLIVILETNMHDGRTKVLIKKVNTRKWICCCNYVAHFLIPIVRSKLKVGII